MNIIGGVYFICLSIFHVRENLRYSPRQSISYLQSVVIRLQANFGPHILRQYNFHFNISDFSDVSHTTEEHCL
ncbi:unnamed protein product, partial [Vitis vinifera]